MPRGGGSFGLSSQSGTTKASRKASSRVSGGSVARARSMRTTRTRGMKGLTIASRKKKKKKRY